MKAAITLARIVIVARPSSALVAALDTVDAVDHRYCDVHIVSPSAETARGILSPSDRTMRSPIRVILMEIGMEIGATAQDVGTLIAGLRSETSTACIPIVLWGPSRAYQELDLENGSWVNSFVSTGPDADANATLIARTINYWASVNRSPGSPHTSLDVGARR